MTDAAPNKPEEPVATAPVPKPRRKRGPSAKTLREEAAADRQAAETLLAEAVQKENQAVAAMKDVEAAAKTAADQAAEKRQAELAADAALIVEEKDAVAQARAMLEQDRQEIQAALQAENEALDRKRKDFEALKKQQAQADTTPPPELAEQNAATQQEPPKVELAPSGPHSIDKFSDAHLAILDNHKSDNGTLKRLNPDNPHEGYAFTDGNMDGFVVLPGKTLIHYEEFDEVLAEALILNSKLHNGKFKLVEGTGQPGTKDRMQEMIAVLLAQGKMLDANGKKLSSVMFNGVEIQPKTEQTAPVHPGAPSIPVRAAAAAPKG